MLLTLSSEVKGRGYRSAGKKRIQNENRELKIVCYADNALIIPEDKDNLRRL